MILFPVVVSAEEGVYSWNLTVSVGGASLCAKQGCFGPGGLAVGAAFGRNMTDRWSFELDGAYVRTNEALAPRVDIATGVLFYPELDRTRIWGGGTFSCKLYDITSTSHLFISLGLVGGYEQQVEKTPLGIFHAPTRDIGVKGGVSGGVGINYWFSENWGVRPEMRFYAVVGAVDEGSLSGLRYSAGIVKKF